ncbi:tetratricopeptide repeat protein [Scytonema tolypothrichoides VB-61278]|nr:tetratricopeptide repeat protein [Scytonema tolypothrichoides VB-61278]
MCVVNLKSLTYSVLAKPLICVILGSLSVIDTFPLVLADTTYPQKNNNDSVVTHDRLSTLPQNKRDNASNFILAQIGDRDEQERSRLIQEANVFYNQRNFAAAEENLRKLIKKFPKDAFAHYQLGNVLYQQDKAEEAIGEYKQAIRFNSSYALAHNAMGIALASQTRWEEAIAEFQKALKINPEYADALASLGQVLWQKGNRDEALASVNKALNIFKAQNRPDKVYQVQQLLQKMKATEDPSVS